MDTPEITLPEHEAHSAARAAHIESTVQHTKEASQMTQPINLFHTPAADTSHAALIPAAMMAAGGMHNRNDFGGGSAIAAALGAAVGAAFGNGNGFGNRNNLTGAGIELGTARVAFDTVAMQSLNAIGAAIPAATGLVADKVTTVGGQLQNAIAAGFAAQTTNTLQQTFLLSQQLAAAQAALQSELCTINQNVSAQGCATREAVVAGDTATQNLINKLNTDNLQRELGVAQVALLESNRRRDHDQVIAQITNTNTAVAAQQQGQAQFQQQQIANTVAALVPAVSALISQNAFARATNSNLNVGNTGAVTTGAQTSTASPVNVAA